LVDLVILITPEELERFGRFLFGRAWRNGIAEALNVEPRRVKEMASGIRRLTPNQVRKILELVDLQRDELRDRLVLFEQTQDSD